VKSLAVPSQAAVLNRRRSMPGASALP